MTPEQTTRLLSLRMREKLLGVRARGPDYERYLRASYFRKGPLRIDESLDAFERSIKYHLSCRLRRTEP